LNSGFLCLPIIALVALAGCLFILRLTAPPNLLDYDQERPAAYVLDAVQNGHWICQRDLSGDISSKPPLWTWISAMVTMAAGRISFFSLYLPCFIGVCGTILILFAAGRRYFGPRAAFLAAAASMLTPAGFKQLGLARTDTIFMLTVTVAALLAFRAWMSGRGWTWFWLAAAVATLTKGPLGVVLAAGGLLAASWERRSGRPLPLRGGHVAGILAYAAIVGGWFLLAYHQYGTALTDKMLCKELIGHACSDGNGTFPGMHFYQPPLYFLAQSAPWSLLTFVALWRVWKFPARDNTVRRFERFLFCWFLLGLTIFSLAPNQRGDHLWPILPAAALLAGYEMERLARSLAPSVVFRCAVAAILVETTVLGVYYFGPRARLASVRQTTALAQLAHEIEHRGGPQFPLSHTDDRPAFQICLNTLRPAITAERAAQLLRSPEPAFVAINNIAALQSARHPSDPPLVTLAGPDISNCPTRIVSNQSRLEPIDSAACCVGPFMARWHHLRLDGASEHEWRVTPCRKNADITIVNQSVDPQLAGVAVLADGKNLQKKRVLAPGESWRLVLN
jgi:4-amino-4-deoxy-L-arabinose transferase-like glycosyltransferase